MLRQNLLTLFGESYAAVFNLKLSYVATTVVVFTIIKLLKSGCS
jgi:hypothetical protein